MLVVGLGAFVLLAGLCISFYFLPARLFVQVRDAAGGGAEVGIAATTVRGYDVFEERFAEIVEAVRRTEPPAPETEATTTPVLGGV